MRFFSAVLNRSSAEPTLKRLFNGKDITNFKAEEAGEFWRVEDGVQVHGGVEMKCEYRNIRIAVL